MQPEIFKNPAESGGHSIYPLFQPALEAVLSQTMGGPQLEFFHAELWLLFVAAIWTAALLISRAAGPQRTGWPVWLAALALLSLTPAALHNVAIGYADVTGSTLLATGALALALWLEEDAGGGYLAVASVLLAAAANVKDEDLIASALVLIVAGVATIVGTRLRVLVPEIRNQLFQFGGALLYFVAVVAPWRTWVAIHHLSDSVEPPLPHALSPAYILSRSYELKQSATAILTQTLAQWGWLAPIFIAACAVCVITHAGRRAAAFYLTTVVVIACSLLWLYTTTPVNLGFLIPTSMDRTVGVFMIPAAVATAHLLARLLAVSPRFAPAERATTDPLLD